MNEKIIELYAQAKQSTKQGRMNASMGVVAEKFAELIVDECLSMCVVDSGEGSLGYKTGIIFAMNRCQQNIKEHFGVEE